MGYTTEITSEKKINQKQTNPMKQSAIKLNKSEFYSFLQELNYKTELGME